MKKYFLYIFLLLSSSFVRAQQLLPATRQALDQVEKLQLQNKSQEVFVVLEKAIHSTQSPYDLAYLYAHQSAWHIAADSLLKGKKLVDLSFENALKSKKDIPMAVAYRAKAHLNNVLNLPDAVVNDALAGLKYLQANDEDLVTKYSLNYLLYGAYSKWDDDEKMEKYIRICQQYALRAKNINLQANVSNGLSSMYQARHKKSGNNNLLDSSLHYLNMSFNLHQLHPEEISGNTFVITCINLANYYLEFSQSDIETRKQQAFKYLGYAEEKLKNKVANPEMWMNVYGIKSGFEKKEGNLELTEQYLLSGLNLLMSDNGNHYKLEYMVYKDLGDIALKKGDIKLALTYQQKAEKLLKQSFNEQQLFNAQKLEIQYETEKKNRELELLKEREAFRKKQNYLYGGIASALLFGLIFMFVSYHFKLRYSIERERKLSQEKKDAEQQAEILLKLEKEEQARLKAEQELLDLRRQQLEKEALANSLIIERKNDTLKQIQDKIQGGEAAHVQKLIKEEMMMHAGFDDIKMQIQQLHPDFFNRLNEKSVQKLTSLDLKYCTYIYLKMHTKQIAQNLNVEPQSVRMFKYRLKQKFGLSKKVDLEEFLGNMDFQYE